MEAVKQIITIAVFIFLVSFYFTGITVAQDATVVDPKHYKVEFENDQMRVLRINYGPGEKSVMHSHPEGLVVFLTDGKSKFTYKDGTSEDMNFEAGQVIWTADIQHQPENTGNEPFEVIQIEMKNDKGMEGVNKKK